jgi:uncharacterized protein YcfJ
VAQLASPREVCWDEEVTEYKPPRERAATYTPVLLGGIAGGIIGIEFGMMAIADTLFGSSLGYGASHRPSRASSRLTTMHRCSRETQYHAEERIEGYQVIHRYRIASSLNAGPSTWGPHPVKGFSATGRLLRHTMLRSNAKTTTCQFAL